MDYALLVKPDDFSEHQRALDQDVAKTQKRKRRTPADTRLKQYKQANYRRRFLKEQPFRLDLKTVPHLKPQPHNIDPESIVSTLPPTLRAKGYKLLEHMLTIKDLGVTEKGEIAYKGNIAEGSKIAELVHDMVRNRPTRSPAVGWDVLLDALKDSNVPGEYIGNPARRKLIKTTRSLQFGGGVRDCLLTLKWKKY